MKIHHPLCIASICATALLAACGLDSRRASLAGSWEADSSLGHGDRLQFALRLETTAPGQVRGLVGLFVHPGWVTWVRGYYHGDSLTLTMLEPCQVSSTATPVAIGFTGMRVPDSSMLRGEVWDRGPEAPWVTPVTLRRGLSRWMADQFQEFERACPGGFPSSEAKPPSNKRLKLTGARQ